MRRIPTMMASAGAAALTALAVSVAGPAIGDDGGAGTDRGAADALGACLSAHGVTGAPAGDALKAWLGRRLDAGDATTNTAMEACSRKQMPPADRAADEQHLRSCLAANGADVPEVEGRDLKRWIIEHRQEPTTAAALKACHLVIDDHPVPGGCDKASPAGEGASEPGDKPGGDDEATTAKRAKAPRT